MLKRPLNHENKENEPENSTSSTFNSINSDASNPAKKVKLTAQENVPVANPLPSLAADIDDDDDDDDEEEKGPRPIASVVELNEGTVHPKNKQYFVYENTEPSMISKTARLWSRRYLTVLRYVDPDDFEMYVHNDFASYGQLEVIENCLLDLAKGVFLKHSDHMSETRYITAFRRLEALTIVLDAANLFPGIDDGERFDHILGVIGACYVTILCGLLPKAMINNGELNNDDMRKLKRLSRQIPNFQEVIKRALLLGRLLLSIGSVGTAYTNILQTVYRNWSFVVNGVLINLNDKAERKEEDIWEALKHAEQIKRGAFGESFHFLHEMEDYSTTYPDLGGHSHDLRTWSQTKRMAYLLSNSDSDDDNDEEEEENFWFRL